MKKRKTLVEKRLQGLSRNDTVLFAWLCAVRCLPFLEWKGTFNYWPKDERQKFLLSTLMALDTVAYSTYCSAQAIVNYASDDAFSAAVSFEGCSDVTIFSAMNIIAMSTTYVTHGEHDIHEIAAMAAYGLHINLESVLLQDLEDIAAGKRTFYNDLLMYGTSWDNFQTALRDLDCAYWGEWYANLFAKGLSLDEKDKAEIELRLSAPYSVVAQGAASVAKYISSRPTTEEVDREQSTQPYTSAPASPVFNINNSQLAIATNGLSQHIDMQSEKKQSGKGAKIGIALTILAIIVSVLIAIFSSYLSDLGNRFFGRFNMNDRDDRFELLIGAWEVRHLGMPSDDVDEEILEMFTFIQRRVFFEDGTGIDSVFVRGITYIHEWFTWSIQDDSLSIEGGLLSGELTLPFRVTETTLFFGYDGSQGSQFLVRIDDDEVYLQTHEDLLIGEWFSYSITGREAEWFSFFSGGVGFFAFLEQHECICEYDCPWMLSGFYWELIGDKIQLFFPISPWNNSSEIWDAQFIMSENAISITIHNKTYNRNPSTPWFRNGWLEPNRHEVTRNIVNRWVLTEQAMLYSGDNGIFTDVTYLFSSMFDEQITFTEEILLDDLPVRAGFGTLLDERGHGLFTWMAPSDEFGLGILYIQFPFYAASIVNGYAYTFLFSVDELTLTIFERDGSMLTFEHSVTGRS